MAAWELALLFPPLARFFVGLLLVVLVVGGEVLFVYLITNMYYGEEE